MSDSTFRIHPTIGLARVGNSKEYYIAPETPAGLPLPDGGKTTGGLPIKKDTESQTITSSDIRDGNGAFKRQAARFKIYQYPAQAGPESYPNGLSATEITIGSSVGKKVVQDIIWMVHLANKKANTFVLVEDPKQHEGISGYESGRLPPIRNPKDGTQPPTPADKKSLLNDPDRVRKLTIDPGPRTISGKPSTATQRTPSKS